MGTSQSSMHASPTNNPLTTYTSFHRDESVNMTYNSSVPVLSGLTEDFMYQVKNAPYMVMLITVHKGCLKKVKEWGDLY